MAVPDLEEANRAIREEAARAVLRKLGSLEITNGGEVVKRRYYCVRPGVERHVATIDLTEGGGFKLRAGFPFDLHAEPPGPELELHEPDMRLVRLWAAAKRRFPGFGVDVTAQRAWSEERGDVAIEFRIDAEALPHQALLRKRWGLEPFLPHFVAIAERLRSRGIRSNTDQMRESGPNPIPFLTVHVAAEGQFDTVAAALGETFPHFWERP